jgi:hypothetical protein
MQSLSGTDRPESYFMHPFAFPMLLLPWWLEGVIRGAPDRDFQTDVAYSTFNGYYFIRIIDDLMDRERQPAPEILPALVFFHTEFQSAFFDYFPHDDGFWRDFKAVSFASAEMASRDARLADVERTDFLEISSQKVAGAKVPIAAVCHRYKRPDLIAPWFDLVDRLGRSHQMLNDVLDWSRDLDHQRSTYFLSEALRQKGSHESVAEWVIHDGLKWGTLQLDQWADDLASSGQVLGCPSLVTYLARMRRAAAEQWGELGLSLRSLEQLATAIRATSGSQVVDR